MLGLACGPGACIQSPSPHPAQVWAPSRALQRHTACSQHLEGGLTRGGSSSRALPPRRQRRRRSVPVVQAAAAKPGGSREQLPIFPLGIVALPAADVPLQIFEARYRVLFSTLMSGANGIDEGLVNPDKPWCGTRLFGMAFYDSNSSGLASIGTLLEIREHANLEDGRLLVSCVGCQRFRILEVLEEKPVLVCQVEYLPDDADPTADTPEARALAAEVAELFRGVVSLSVKLKNSSVPADIANPRQLSELGPCQLSFWVASLFAGNPYQQQALLEEETTLGRLKAVQELLGGTVKYLSAQVALQSAFKTTGGGGATPPPGGPD